PGRGCYLWRRGRRPHGLGSPLHADLLIPARPSMDTEPILRITEIFHSLQGEGFHAGTPAVFVRGTGCNLACDFCDTDFSQTDKLTPAQVAERVAAFGPCRLVELTGAEHTLQPTYRILVDMLHAK